MVVQVAADPPGLHAQPGSPGPSAILPVLAEIEKDVAILSPNRVGHRPPEIGESNSRDLSFFNFARMTPPLHWSYFNRSNPQRAYCSASCLSCPHEPAKFWQVNGPGELYRPARRPQPWI